MSLQGLPDFHQPLRGDGFEIFYPYEGAGHHILSPSRLEIALRPEGHPDFLLESVRGQTPLLPPAPYGVLDLRVQPHYQMEAALSLLRGRYPDDLITPALFSSGFLRMQPAGDTQDVPADLCLPAPLAWNGLTTGRWILKLSFASVLLLKGALINELVALYATAEVELMGVAPRLPLRVRFDPAALLRALAALSSPQRQLARTHLVDFFRQDLSSLPLQVIGEITDPEEFALTMADWIRVRFGTFVPSPQADGQLYLALVAPEQIGSGSFEWDLSQPLQTWRALALTLHPLEAARQLVREQGITAVMRETVVPPLATGIITVSISANLPAHRPGVLAVGVTLYAPPRLPHRPQAVSVTAELQAPEDTATLRLRLSPAEAPEYLFSTFIILNDSAGVSEIKGAEQSHSGDRLYLAPDDFPVSFVPIEASPALLELAVIRGRCRQPGTMVEQSFTLDFDQPAIALALPKETPELIFEIEACARDGSKTLRLGPLSARNLQLGLHSFREYGPHRVEINCIFDDTTPLFAIDILPEGLPETPQTMSVLHFTPTHPVKVWNWFASSPFQAGYRYRRVPAVDETPEPWSAFYSPFEPLVIHAATI